MILPKIGILIALSVSRGTAFVPRLGSSYPFLTRLAESTAGISLESVVDGYSKAFEACKGDLTKTCKVKVASVPTGRLGLVATQSISKGDVIVSTVYDDRYMLTGNLAKSTVFKDALPKTYDSWTGEAGLIALLILNEVARLVGKGSAAPTRPEAIQGFVDQWMKALPHPKEMDHPLLWSEEDQEILQSSTTNKIYRQLDDIEEDANWLTENVFDKDRSRFPETIKWNGDSVPCFSIDGFKWAMAIAQSRSFFVDGFLRLMPLFDMCNHDDFAEEIVGASMGTFGGVKGAKVVASCSYNAGDEIFCSYGPKSAADYLLEHGFCPPKSLSTSVCELTLQVDPEDRFYEDKLDILEYETYDQAPMDPTQSFDVISAAGRDGEPDPALMQFVRLAKLGTSDAFLLESIFRKDVWGFMALPVSENNELLVVNSIAEACQKALDDFGECPEGGRALCTQLRESESKALVKTIEYLRREREALDLKEYYQERRLKDLGLDSPWSPEDDVDSDLSYGQARAPGGADYDW